MAATALTTPRSVQARIRYALPGQSKLFCYEYDPPAGTPRRSAQYREYTVMVGNGRTCHPPLSLDRDGFALVRHASAVRDFYDARELSATYDGELAALIRRATGAASVLVFDHTVRGEREAMRDERRIHAPVSRAHNDYTPDSAPRRARQLLGAADAERLLAGRFIEINVWRAIRGPLQSMPLAVCSAASMRPADFLPCDLIYPDRLGEIYEIAWSPRHEWYWFPDMQPDEALLLKCYDSAAGQAGCGAHSAFEHPETPADAPPRESIESRAFAFFAG